MRQPLVLFGTGLLTCALAACGGSSSSDDDSVSILPSITPSAIPSATPTPTTQPSPTPTIVPSATPSMEPSPEPNAEFSSTVETKRLFELVDFPVGVATETYTRGGKEQYAHDLVRTQGDLGDKRRAKVLQHFNSISPTNAFKMKPLQREYREFYFGPCQKEFTARTSAEDPMGTGDADCLLDFAEDNGIDHVHLQSLVWYVQQPNWMRGGKLQETLEAQKAADPNFDFDGTADREEYLAEMEYHIEQTMCAFADRIDSIVVVNEAFSDYGYNGNTKANPSGLRSADDSPNDDHSKRLYWADRIGSDYIELAFFKAQEALDNTTCRTGSNDVDLYINDYQLVVNSAKRRVFLDYINNFLDADREGGAVPIDGIGIQMHFDQTFNSSFTADNIRVGLKELVATGLKIRFTEIDVRGDIDKNGTLSESELALQKDKFKDILTVFMEEVPPAQRGGIAFWGMADRWSWLDTMPLLFDNNMDEKPALQGVAEGMKATYQEK